MTQKSGLEMIENLLERVELLDRRFTVVEQIAKELLSRSNGFMPPAQAVPTTQPLPPTLSAAAPRPSIVGTEPSITSMEAMNASVMKATTNTTKVMGKIKNKEGKTIIGAQVTVVKENGEIVKQTKTNRAGEWMCFLPTGIYKARYFLDKTITASVDFSINPAQTIIRVAQPKWE